MQKKLRRMKREIKIRRIYIVYHKIEHNFNLNKYTIKYINISMYMYMYINNYRYKNKIILLKIYFYVFIHASEKID